MNKKTDPIPMFSLVASNESGVAFKNELKESLLMNGLFYEYFYNGGGVAIGDFNQDNQPDLYFISNLESNKLYLNQGNLKFKDVTEASQTKGKYGFPTGVTTVDINGDGKLDIYIAKSGRFKDPAKRKNELYINLGNDSNGVPMFKENAAKYGLDIETFSTQAAFFDYDRDGDLDLFLINHGIQTYSKQLVGEMLNKKSQFRGERLYRNEDGQFIDVSDQSGIINNMLGYGLGIAISDFNNDQWPDVLVGNDFSEKDHMYINNQDGTFTEVSQTTVNHMSNFSMGNDVADINNDGWMDFISVDMMSEHNYDIKTSMGGMNPARFSELVDLGLHHQYMFNTMQINNGTQGENNLPYFSDVAQLAGVAKTDWSWAPLFLDMDNDGLKDLFVSNGVKRDFRNNDFIIYRKKKQAEIKELKKKGIAFDQKAYIRDMMAHMPSRKKANYFYKNNGGLSFSKISLAGLDSLLTSSNGASYADLDNDGDLDIVVNNSDDKASIYRNNSTELNNHNYLKIKLIGAGNNRDGIGSKITLKYDNKLQVLEQQLTRGFQSSVSRILHFGLNTNDKIEELTIVWPDGKTQRIQDVMSNQTLWLNYQDANNGSDDVEIVTTRFIDITVEFKLEYLHEENNYNDFEKESLLPHKMSQFGPALAVGDVNNDGREDVFVGGSKGLSGVFFLQSDIGTFEKRDLNFWLNDSKSEDLDAVFFDADRDGDLDLYVVSGGSEFAINSEALLDRLYINDGKGNFTKNVTALPKLYISGACVRPADYDGDGDMDLFVGGRLIPGQYPNPADSYILRNDSGAGGVSFSKLAHQNAPFLSDIGMVTDASWTDIDGDQDLDLIVVGEWMTIKVFEQTEDGFEDITERANLENTNGWWFSISSADMDNDGDMDLVVGNLGLNYKYRATPTEPFEIYTSDFDSNESLDIVLGYYDEGELYPVRGRQCSSNQMPFVKEKFSTYDQFGSAKLKDVYGEQKLDSAVHYKAKVFAHVYLENDGSGSYTIHKLPTESQTSSVNSIILKDQNGDGNKDILMVGNLYASEVETTRNDAGYGYYLEGDGKGNFRPVSSQVSGLFIKGDSKHIKEIELNDGAEGYVVVKNQELIQLIKNQLK